MIIINSHEEVDSLLKNLTGTSKTIGRFSFLGELHDGHRFIINKIKEECDEVVILYGNHSSDLASYIEYGNFIDFRNKKPIIKSCENSNADYVCVIDQNMETNRKFIKKFVDQYKTKVFEECNRLGISKDLAIQTLMCEVPGLFEPHFKTFIGPKFIVPTLLSKKILGAELHHPHIFWDFYHDLNENVVSRTRHNTILSMVQNVIIRQIKEGKTSKETFNEILRDYYGNKGSIVILSLDTVEPLNEINNNCFIILMAGKVSETIFIKEGNLIY